MSAERMTMSRVIERLTERTDMGRRPHVALKRSVAPGRQGIVEVEVSVPVCDEFPTLASAEQACKRVFSALDRAYPMPKTDGGAK